MAEPRFPTPRRVRGRKFYSLNSIINYERALAGLPPVALDPAEERWLPSRQVRDRFDVSDMWLWRREREAEAAKTPEAA